MRKKIFLIGALILITQGVTAVDVSVGTSCPDGTEPLVSLNKTDGGHVAEPGYYPNQVCVDDAENLGIGLSCSSGDETLFSMANKTNSHLSIFENQYSYSLCSGSLRASVKDSCVNGTKTLSVTDKTNTHAAAPSYNADPYNKSLCLTTKSPENVTLELNGVSGTTYASQQEITTGEELYPPVEFPYIVSEQPLGIVNYGDFLKLSRPTSDTVSMTSAGQSSFLVPFSDGGQTEIEKRQKEINERVLIEQIEPSFGEPLQSMPLVRVIYRPNLTIGNDNSNIRERGDLTISNSGIIEDSVRITLD